MMQVKFSQRQKYVNINKTFRLHINNLIKYSAKMMFLKTLFFNLQITISPLIESNKYILVLHFLKHEKF